MIYITKRLHADDECSLFCILSITFFSFENPRVTAFAGIAKSVSDLCGERDFPDQADKSTEM